jgi:hypothetical protein
MIGNNSRDARTQWRLQVSYIYMHVNRTIILLNRAGTGTQRYIRKTRWKPSSGDGER